MLLIIIENPCYHYFKNDNILKMAEYQDINKEWSSNLIRIISNAAYTQDRNYKGKSGYDRKIVYFILSLWCTKHKISAGYD